MEETQVATWHVLGASVAGTSHARLGRGCEDDHVFRTERDGIVLIAVADGAGSAKFAARGASCAVQAVASSFCARLAETSGPLTKQNLDDLLKLLLQDARQAVEQLVGPPAALPEHEHANGYPPIGSTPGPPDRVWGESQFPATTADLPSLHSGVPSISAPCEPSVAPATIESSTMPARGADGQPEGSSHGTALRDFATTLLIACLTPDFLAALQIGDGAIVVQSMDSTLQSVIQVARGEYLNETDFLTHPDYLAYVRSAVIPATRLKGVAVLSDGMQMLALKIPENVPHPPFFTPLFAFATKAEHTDDDLAAFLQSPRVNARTDDDKTLVLAVRV